MDCFPLNALVVLVHGKCGMILQPCIVCRYRVQSNRYVPWFFPFGSSVGAINFCLVNLSKKVETGFF